MFDNRITFIHVLFEMNLLSKRVVNKSYDSVIITLRHYRLRFCNLDSISHEIIQFSIQKHLLDLVERMSLCIQDYIRELLQLDLGQFLLYEHP